MLCQCSGQVYNYKLFLPLLVPVPGGLLEERVQRRHLRLAHLGALHHQHPVEVGHGAVGQQPRELPYEALSVALQGRHHHLEETFGLAHQPDHHLRERRRRLSPHLGP